MHKRTHTEDELKLAWLARSLNGRPMAEITREEVAAIGERKREHSSPATANLHLALVRAILRKACFEWGRIDTAPKVKLYRESARRVRWLTPRQAQRLLAELPEHQREVVLFALATGLRQGTWSGCAGHAWICGDGRAGSRQRRRRRERICTCR